MNNLGERSEGTRTQLTGVVVLQDEDKHKQHFISSMSTLESALRLHNTLISGRGEATRCGCSSFSDVVSE